MYSGLIDVAAAINFVLVMAINFNKGVTVLSIAINPVHLARSHKFPGFFIFYFICVVWKRIGAMQSLIAPKDDDIHTRMMMFE